MHLTERFHKALELALLVHGRDTRKASNIPYFAHLMSVSSLVLSDGGSEDEAIAALLHDTLEDHPGEVTRDQIQAWFGTRVCQLVEICTDTPEDYEGGEKPQWLERKLAYLAHLKDAQPEDLRVPLADKLDNARSILSDYRLLGDKLWERFHAGKDDQLWFYSSAYSAFCAVGVTSPMLDELGRVVEAWEKLAKSKLMSTL